VEPMLCQVGQLLALPAGAIGPPLFGASSAASGCWAVGTGQCRVVRVHRWEVDGKGGMWIELKRPSR